MEKKVTVLTPNGRRQNVKVTPNTTLLQILEETCQKHGFDSDEYCLKHHNKEVGLTQTFRFSGLPNNCLLEMSMTEKKRIAQNVDICVQLEDGSRQQAQFKPSDNLWQVLEQLSAEATVEYASPVVLYMRQEFVGKEQLSGTTLKSLGISEGRAMIRFIDKNPEDLKTQANVYIAPVIKETPKDVDSDTPKSARSTATGAGGFAITKELVQSLKKAEQTTPKEETPAHEESMDTAASSESKSEPSKPKYDWGTGTGRSIRDAAAAEEAAAQLAAAERERLEAEMQMEIEPEVHILGDRNAILYSLDDVTQQQMEDLPDSFFDLTVHDLKLVLRDLKKVVSGSENSPLLTEKMRELEDNKTMLNKLAQYKNCVIRIKFPDRLVLQGNFKPIDNVVNVMDFVRTFLHNPESKFYLFTIPPKTVLPLDKTLLELDFVPNAVVHFALDDDESAEQTFVKEEFLNRLTTAEGAYYVANKFRISNRKESSTDETNNNNEQNSKQYDSKPGPSTGAIPKRPRNDDLKQST